MKRAICSLVILAALAQVSYGVDAAALRPWRNSDSVAFRYYGAFLGHRNNIGQPVAIPSPGGRYFYIVSVHGDLTHDCLVKTLEVFDAEQVMRWITESNDDESRPVPVQKTEMRLGRTLFTSALRDAMRQIQWNEKGTALEFIGIDENGREQAYRLPVPLGPLVRLTNDNCPKGEFAARGEVVIYRRLVPTKPVPDPYPMVAVSRDRAGEVVVPLRAPKAQSEVVVSISGGEPRVLPIKGPNPQIWISPNEKTAIAWETLGSNDGSARIDGRVAFQIRNEEQILFLNLDNKEARQIAFSTTISLTGAPPRPPTLLWSGDGGRMILAGAPLPKGLSRPEHSSSDDRYILAYDIAADTWQILSNLGRVQGFSPSMRWLVPGVHLVVEHLPQGKDKTDREYVLEGTKWIETRLPRQESSRQAAVESKLPSGLEIKVAQSANDAPRVVASVGKQEKTLSSPDPALVGVRLQPVNPFSWKTEDGKTLTAGLTLPPESAGTAPFPLVIQAYHYSPEYFEPAGPYASLYAMQAIAAQGMAVLTLNILDVPGFGTPSEGDQFVARIDSAVEALAKQGVIDPKRVGVIGFSRGGNMTFYAVTHPGRTKLAVAIVADAFMMSYPEYLYFSTHGGGIESYETINQGTPWENPEMWRKHDVLANIGRMEAATLFAYNRMYGRNGDEMDTASVTAIGALKINSKPFEFVFFPDADHNFRLPRQHVAAMDISVDWMSFWLLDREDPSPQKKEQYARWRIVRQKNEERNSEKLKSGN